MTKNPSAVALGKLGGKARALKLSPERRTEIASKGAAVRNAKRKLAKEQKK